MFFNTQKLKRKKEKRKKDHYNMVANHPNKTLKVDKTTPMNIGGGRVVNHP
jgi:hypothetical protein